ncbi:hypothetical protein M0R72_08895 [Candidatus Pacearchaeota archaeon]|jgi:hypothetical protein|nr:hypothetical protein [Candidatus Pacearchaeota archaeon]
MSEVSLSIHGVKGIHTEVHPLEVDTSIGTVFVRNLVVTNRDGERLEFTLFGEDAAALDIQHVTDASRESRNLSLGIKAEEAVR